MPPERKGEELRTTCTTDGFRRDKHKVKKAKWGIHTMGTRQFGQAACDLMTLPLSLIVQRIRRAEQGRLQGIQEGCTGVILSSNQGVVVIQVEVGAAAYVVGKAISQMCTTILMAFLSYSLHVPLMLRQALHPILYISQLYGAMRSLIQCRVQVVTVVFVLSGIGRQ